MKTTRISLLVAALFALSLTSPTSAAPKKPPQGPPRISAAELDKKLAPEYDNVVKLYKDAEKWKAEKERQKKKSALVMGVDMLGPLVPVVDQYAFLDFLPSPVCAVIFTTNPLATQALIVGKAAKSSGAISDKERCHKVADGVAEATAGLTDAITGVITGTVGHCVCNQVF